MSTAGSAARQGRRSITPRTALFIGHDVPKLGAVAQQISRCRTGFFPEKCFQKQISRGCERSQGMHRYSCCALLVSAPSGFNLEKPPVQEQALACGTTFCFGSALAGMGAGSQRGHVAGAAREKGLLRRGRFQCAQRGFKASGRLQWSLRCSCDPKSFWTVLFDKGKSGLVKSPVNSLSILKTRKTNCRCWHLVARRVAATVPAVFCSCVSRSYRWRQLKPVAPAEALAEEPFQPCPWLLV